MANEMTTVLNPRNEIFSYIDINYMQFIPITLALIIFIQKCFILVYS